MHKPQLFTHFSSLFMSFVAIETKWIGAPSAGFLLALTTTVTVIHCTCYSKQTIFGALTFDLVRIIEAEWKIRMSRKSLSKKETAIWYQCNECNWNIFAKDRELHSCTESSETTPSYTFVCNKKLTTTQITEKPVTDDLKGINENKLNNLIFLHESIFPLCDLVLGDFVSITSSALSGNASIVRNAWPMSNQNAGLVCVSNEGNEIFCFWKKFTFFQLSKI